MSIGSLDKDRGMSVWQSPPFRNRGTLLSSRRTIKTRKTSVMPTMQTAVKARFRPLAEAAAWARAQGVRGPIDWCHRVRNHPGWLPDDLPVDPEKTYAEGFARMGGWDGFLGFGRHRTNSNPYRNPPRFLPPTTAGSALTLDTTDFGDVFPGNNHAPSQIDDMLATAYGGWHDSHVSHRRVPGRPTTFRPFAEAAAWASQQGVRGRLDWLARNRDTPGWRPADVPADPSKAYRPVFQTAGGWGYFLDTSSVAPRHRAFRPMAEAAAWARAQGVTSSTEWRRRNRVTPGWRPDDVPAAPEDAYRPDFQAAGGWGVFLGTGYPTPRRRMQRAR